MFQLIIVDDEALIRDGLMQIVQRLAPEWEVAAVCEDAEEAWAAVQRIKPDAILIDIEMPGINGLKLSEQLQESYPSIYKIILTGHDRFQYVQSAIRQGVSDYLLKPLQREELREALNKARNVIETHRARQLEIDLLKRSLLPEAYAELSKAGAGAMLDPTDAANPRNEALTQRQQELLEAIEINDVETVRNLLTQWKQELAHAAVSDPVSLSVGCYHFLSFALGTSLAAIQSRLGQHMKEHLPVLRQEIRHALSVHLLYKAIQKYLSSLHLEQYATNDIANKTVAELKAFIQDNYGNADLNLEHLAKQVYLHPNYISELFRQVTGKTITEYVTEVRMAEARRLLRETRCKTYEIAEMVGYTSAKYFSSIFRRTYGMTPTEYRNRSI